MRTSRSYQPALFSGLLFIVGVLFFFALAALMGLSALISIAQNKEIEPQQSIVLMVSLLQGVILIAAAVVAFQRYLHKPFAERDSSFHIRPWQIALSFIITSASLLAGYWIVENKVAMWLLLPALTVPAVVLPLFLVLGLGVHGLPLGTRWQTWNTFGLAMSITPFALVILEVIALVGIAILGILVLSLQPGMEGQIQRLGQEVTRLDPQSEAAQRLIAPYLIQPGVIVFVMIYFAMIIPLLEEIFKPLGVWLLAKRLDSPAQGFALGALSGSAYALAETLGVSAQSTDWASLLLMRIGTGTLHITTSALMGAGIVYAIRERKYAYLLGIYILSVSLHGLWNALAIFIAFSDLAVYFELESALTHIGTPVNISIAVLALGLLVTLIASNQSLKRTLPPAPLTEAVPTVDPQP